MNKIKDDQDLTELERIKKVIAVLSALAAFFLAFFEFDTLVPEPIEQFEIFGTILVAVAIVGSIFYSYTILKWRRYIGTILIISLVLLIFTHSIYVVNVNYYDESETAKILRGTSISNPDLEDETNHSDIIKIIGRDMESLKENYNNYLLVVNVYISLLLLLIFSFIFSLVVLWKSKE